MPYTFQIGSIPCHIVSDGRQLVDGGGFFGLVPRVLWERVIRPDDKNRIPVQMRSLLVQSSAGLILVDTGQGDKLTARDRRNFGMDDSSRRLAADLGRAGFSPEDVDIVLMTHLHGDHAGGCTHWSDPGDPDSEAVPSFPNARYLVQRLEMADASFPNERTRGTYFPQNWEPLRRSGQLEIVDGDQDLAAGVRTVTVPGHTDSIQAVWVEDAGPLPPLPRRRLQLGRTPRPPRLGPLLRPRPHAQHRGQTRPPPAGPGKERAPRLSARRPNRHRPPHRRRSRTCRRIRNI